MLIKQIKICQFKNTKSYGTGILNIDILVEEHIIENYHSN